MSSNRLLGVALIGIVIVSACDGRGPSVTPTPLPAARSAVSAATAVTAGTAGSPVIHSRPGFSDLPAAPYGAWEDWSLTTTPKEVTGPDNCFSQAQRSRIGKPLDWELAVSRSSSRIALLYDVHNLPTDALTHTGSLSDGTVSAVPDAPSAMKFPSCADGTVLEGNFAATLSAQFSADGEQVTGTEIWSYHFSVGEVRITFGWNGQRLH